MRILVYGAGSLGSLLGGILSQDHEVCLLGRKENIEAICKDGLTITGIIEKKATVSAVTNMKDVPWTPDLVLLTVKSHSTAVACKELVKMAPVPVVSLQNGLGNLETMREVLWDESHVYGAITSMGALLEKPGHVRYTGKGLTRIQTPIDDKVIQLANSLNASGLEIEVVDDITLAIWQKAAVNIGINYITAISGKKNKIIVDDWTVLEQFITDLIREFVEVAGAEGIPLDVKGCLSHILEVATNTANNRSSMLQDVERGRLTENNALAGEVLRRAKAHGIEAPRTHAIHSLMMVVESQG